MNFKRTGEGKIVMKNKKIETDFMKRVIITDDTDIFLEHSRALTDEEKKEIDKAIDKMMKEYGEVIKKLGKS